MLCQYSYFQTIEWSNAGTATVIQYLGPALIVVWVCLRTKRLPEKKEVLGMYLFAVTGIFLIATWKSYFTGTITESTDYGTDFCSFSSHIYDKTSQIAGAV